MRSREKDIGLLSEAFCYIGDDIVDHGNIESLARYYSKDKKGRMKIAFNAFVRHSSRIAAGFAATFIGFAVLFAVLMNVMFGGFGCNSSDKFGNNLTPDTTNYNTFFSYPENVSGEEKFPFLSPPDDKYPSNELKLPWEDDLYATLTNFDSAENSEADNLLYFTVGLKGDYLGSGDIYIKIASDTLKIDASEEINDGVIVIDDLYDSDSRQKVIKFTLEKTSDEIESGIISFEIGYKFDDPDAFAEKLKSYEHYDIIDINRILKNGVLCITKFSVDVSKFID